MILNKNIIFLIFAISLLLLSGCSTKNETPAVDTTPAVESGYIRQLPPQCNMIAGISCDDLVVTDGQITFSMLYGLEPISNVVVSIDTCKSSAKFDLLETNKRYVVTLNQCRNIEAAQNGFNKDLTITYGSVSMPMGVIRFVLVNGTIPVSKEQTNPSTKKIINEPVKFLDTANLNLPKIVSFEHLTEFEELGIEGSIINISKLTKTEPILVTIGDSKIRFDLIDFKGNDPNYTYTLYNKDKSKTYIVHDWAKIKINSDKEEEFPEEEMVKVLFDDGSYLYVAVGIVSDDYVVIVVTDKIIT